MADYEGKPIKPVTRTKVEAQEGYDRLSRRYDRLAGSSERRLKEKAVELLAARKGERILEIGSGTGDTLAAFARQVGGNGHVVGLDLSTGMIRVACDRFRKEGLVERATFCCGDGASLPFAARNFDGIFMSFTLELFDTPEIPVVLAECARTLKQRGRMVVVSLVKSRKPGVAERLYELAHDYFPNFADCRPIYLRSEVARAGFELIEAKSFSMWRMPVLVVLARPLLAKRLL